MANKHYIYILLAFLVSLGACNSKDEPKEIDAHTAPSLAVTKFSINPNSNVMVGLDSVFFSIDLDHRVIYNADSLPMGTSVDKLVPLITYPSTVTKAEITMTGGKTRTGSVDYIANPSDSIDFTGKVALRLSTYDDSNSITYTLKVNVHQCVGDSLMWDREAVAPLPSRYAHPKAQKTIDCNDKIITLIEENDNSFTIASCKNPATNSWTKNATTIPAGSIINSLTHCNNLLYLLNQNGDLYSSSDEGNSWALAASPGWSGIIGPFNNSLLGIKGPDASPTFDIYPRPADFTPRALPADFPTANASPFNIFSSEWSTSPIGFFTGGSRGDKTYGDTWAYDGENWAKISNNPLPPLKNAVIAPYFSYRQTNNAWIQTEFSVWLCMGGLLADGSVNPTLYISYDNGVNWRKASSLMQYPEFVRPGAMADAIISTSPMSSSLDATWQRIASAKRAPQMRLNYFVDGNDIDWECPYIYLFGGYDEQKKLNDEIRRAVLARLTFTPIF